MLIFSSTAEHENNLKEALLRASAPEASVGATNDLTDTVCAGAK